MAVEPNAVEQVVSRTLRDNLEKILRTVGELDQAIHDLVSACASSRPTNTLPSMIRAQASAASLGATLDVLSRFVTASLQPDLRLRLEEEISRSGSGAQNVSNAAPSSGELRPVARSPVTFAEASSTVAPSPHQQVETILEAPVSESPEASAAWPDTSSAIQSPASPVSSEEDRREAITRQHTGGIPWATSAVAEDSVTPEQVAREAAAFESAFQHEVELDNQKLEADSAPATTHSTELSPSNAESVAEHRTELAEEPPALDSEPAHTAQEAYPDQATGDRHLAEADSHGAERAELYAQSELPPVLDLEPATEPASPIDTNLGSRFESHFDPSDKFENEAEHEASHAAEIEPLVDPVKEVHPLVAVEAQTEISTREPKPKPEPEPAFAVSSLDAEQQELHKRAKRVAKVSMQDIKMLRPEAVRLGRENSDLCVRLSADIEKAHKEYNRRFQSIQSHPVDYFYDWMVEILAGGHPEALGEYPYPSPVPRR